VEGDNPRFSDVTDPASPARRWRCDPVNAAYVHAFLDLADRRGLPVFWVIPPLSPALQAKRFRNGAEDAYDRFAAGVRARHPGLTVIDARRMGLDKGSFVDTSHLSWRGAERLSAAVAEVLAERVARRRPGPGWVDLGPSAAPADAPASLSRRGEPSRR
jgi:hypothetical protein